MHPGHLLGREHEHGIIVNVIHIVHEHVAIRTVAAGDVWKGRFSIVWSLGVRRIIGKIAAAAVLGIPPYVAQIEPMADLVGRRSPQVKWRRCTTACAEGGVQDHHTVGSRRATRKLRIPKETAPKRTDPDIQIPVAWPWIGPTAGG